MLFIAIELKLDELPRPLSGGWSFSHTMTMSLAKRVWTASLLLPLLLLEGRSSAERDCAGLAAAGDCEFYRCLDGLLGGCGSGAYPLGFGHKYCKRFQDSKELFDVEVR